MALLNDDGLGDLPRLSDVLFNRAEIAFCPLAILGSNYEAIQAAKQFTSGVERQIAIVGPSGWGKSSLLDAIAVRLGQARDQLIPRTSAREFLRSQPRGDQSMPLVLDDVQEVLELPKAKMEMRTLLERRLRTGSPTALAFTMERENRSMLSLLPNSREWRIAPLRAARSSEWVTLIQRVAEMEQLALSADLVYILAKHLHGDGRTLAGALNRLKLSGSEWLDPRASVTALGLLDPYFADNPNWDLRMQIAKVAGQLLPSAYGMDNFDLALYTMLHEAKLPESSISQSLGLPPHEVYRRASSVLNACRTAPETENCVTEFSRRVIMSLF
jgi:hypothetical protein